jgi:hypothetical protein
MIEQGEIEDAKTIVGVLAYLQFPGVRPGSPASS